MTSLSLLAGTTVLIKFQADISYTFCVMLQIKYNYEKEWRTITPKLCKRELWFLYTALILITIYLSMKFQVDISRSFV